MKEKRTIEKFLRVNGYQRIEKHDQKPKPRRALQKREKQLGCMEANGQAEQDDEERVSKQELREMWPDASGRNKPSLIEGAVVIQKQERDEAYQNQVRNRQIREDTIKNEQGSAKEEENKLQRK